MGDAFVVEGDCLSVLPSFPDSSFDSIVTDPPYGLSFLGHEWDHGVPGAPFWREALRVAKPGAYLVAFGGPRTFHRLGVAIEDAGWEIVDCLSWLYSNGMPKGKSLPGGFATRLKPAWEPGILARKPLDGTAEANLRVHGVGAFRVDECRIPFLSEEDREEAARPRGHMYSSLFPNMKRRVSSRDPRGRLPANVAMDEAAAEILHSQTGIKRSHGGRGGVYGRKANTVLGGRGLPDRAHPETPSDEGAVSRFFYVSRASTKERDEGTSRNDHPTVKPLDLMRWVVRLVTPPGGVCLDPFAGSGTTGVAAIHEGRGAVLIEREPRYAQIANDRIRHAAEGVRHG